ncbi:MAG TPA: c-type cytochrome [Cyclobacteriaceae bacterium]|nr:c-type cytochrome [Cyclobacteriaceae bacterium]
MIKKLLVPVIVVGAMLIWSCAPDKPKTPRESFEDIHGNVPAGQKVQKPGADGKGIGEVKNVTLNTPLEQDRIARGKSIYEMKCQACHRLDDVRVVGPGFQGITSKRKPEWIMNMITNVDVMLDNDPTAQALLELCLMRMPNQNVSIGDARDILEFMRENDED